jgi:uncharacterized protein
MIINLHRLASDGETFEGEEPAQVWALEHDPDVKAEKPISYRIHVVLVSGELIAMGRVASEVSFRCSRCGEFSKKKIEEPDFECAIEAGTTEDVDLTNEIRESMILRFPSFPLCRKSCKGLCKQCGKNLNGGACGCSPPDEKRWDALGGLSLN